MTNAFGVPGAAINPLYAALRERQSITHILARHVEAASHMAEGFTRARTGNIGVCIGTSCPAGTDMITGLYSAGADSIPILRLLIEPINTCDIPGFWLNRTAQAVAVLDEVGAANAFIQYDIYHAQRMEGELAGTIEKYLSRIGHVQLADNPGRNEPGTGEIHYPFLFQLLDRLGYAGWVGCEYKPAAGTEAGLGWRWRLVG